MPKKPKRKDVIRNKLYTSKLDIIEDSDSNDNSSYASSICGSVINEGFADEVDPVQSEVFEDKLCEAIEGMSEKSLQTRTNSFQAVSMAFTKKYIPEFIITRQATLSDAIEKSLKKGRGAEQAAAAQLATLMSIQLGATQSIDELCLTLIPALNVIVNDKSMSAVVRAKCCWALGLLSFIGNYEKIDQVMQTLQNVYECKLGEDPTLHTAAISAWCLLLTVAEADNSVLSDYMKQTEYLLDSLNLDVRMAAGEVIAVLWEQSRKYKDSSEGEPEEELVEKLQLLATDSQKCRAKKDRKTQRSTFRDIMRYIESGESPRVQIQFGQECLSLDSWCRKKQYDAFCQALGSGINYHLKENVLLRDVMHLGEKLAAQSEACNKQSKVERQQMNAAANKARTISRGKNRDKRLEAL